jgi:membrane-associated phospholipid phosphatase
MLLLTNPYIFGGQIDPALLTIKFFFISFLFPVLVTFMMIGLKLVPSIQMGDKKDRILPLIATMLFYIWLFVNLYQSGQMPDALLVITLGSILALVIGFLVNMMYKISFHAIGAGGMVGMGSLIYIFFAHEDFDIALLSAEFSVDTQFLLLLTILLAGLVMTARVYLEAHSLKQVYSGAVIGFLSQWVAYGIINLI